MEDKYEQYDLDEAIKIADDTWNTEFEKDNSKKKYKSVYKKGGHGRCW